MGICSRGEVDLVGLGVYVGLGFGWWGLGLGYILGFLSAGYLGWVSMGVSLDGSVS